MITNQRQYGITKKQLRDFESAIKSASSSGPAPGVHERLHKAMLDGLKGQAADLRAEIKRYEALRSGKVRKRSLQSWRDVPVALIEGRIAAGLTQGAVAKRLGIAEQQMQRYESTRYAGASLDRVQEVADAVGLKIEDTVKFAVVKATASRTAPKRGRSKSTATKYGGSANVKKSRVETSKRGKAPASRAASKAARSKSSTRRAQSSR